MGSEPDVYPQASLSRQTRFDLPTIYYQLSQAPSSMLVPTHAIHLVVYFQHFVFFFLLPPSSQWQQFLCLTSPLHASTWPRAWRIRRQLFPHWDDSARLHKSISNSHNMAAGQQKILTQCSSCLKKKKSSERNMSDNNPPRRHLNAFPLWSVESQETRSLTKHTRKNI